jgi:cytidylate kinase
MFRVITVAREYGSGGGVIAQQIAGLLGWQLLDRNLIAAVARTAQVDVETARRYDESVDSWWHRINRSGFWSAAVEAGVAPVDTQFFDAETMAAMAHEVIAGAAAQGNCVVVGRGGQCLLQGCAEALHVFVYAPWEMRVARVRDRLGTDGEVEELLRATDRTRATYVRRYFGRDWKDPGLYHLMIGSQLGDEIVARLVAGAVESGALNTRLQATES